MPLAAKKADTTEKRTKLKKLFELQSDEKYNITNIQAAPDFYEQLQ